MSWAVARKGAPVEIQKEKKNDENSPQVFKTMAAVVDPDFIGLIPENPDLFFWKLELLLDITHTTAGPVRLIQGR